MAGGYMGKILHINLSSQESYIETIDYNFQRKYLGGNGFGAYLLYREVEKGIDPLSEKNVIIFSTGPVTGTPFTSSAMTSVVTKSPLTGFFLDSYFGGHYGPELKHAGFDAIVIKGVSENPVHLLICDDKVELKDAGHLWGKNTYETQEIIKEELGLETQVACIGPAGENLVKYASIVSGTRLSGRGGVGAVLGSKKLKAITVYGTQTINVPNADALMQFSLDNNNKLKDHPGAGKNFPTYGSTASPASYSAMGIFGTRNWQTETFPEAEKISGEYNKKRGLLIKSRACSACIIRSSKVWKAKNPPYCDFEAEGPEYETLFSLGSMCGNSNFESIIAANRLCDEYGIDTITAGATIAFAMECYEKGIINRQDTDDLELVFGNHKAIIELIKKISKREGFGNFLAEGTKRMAEKLGTEAQKLTVHVKGYEFAGHSARAHKGMALGYATSNRGASHQDTRVTPERNGTFNREEIEGKGRFAKETQDMTTIGDCLIVCRRATETSFGFFLNEKILKLVNLVTGHNYTLDELQEVAERVYTLEKLFNVREGVERKDDTLPFRFLNEPIPEGPTKGMYVTEEELNKMLDEYYKVRNWDIDTGYPTEKELKRLGLDNIL